MASDDEPVILFDETHHFLPPRSNHWSPPAMDFNHVVVSHPRGYGKKTVAEAFEEFGRAWQRLADELSAVMATVPVVEFARHRLDSWIEPPPSVMERAIQARKNRNTGPVRPSGPKAHAPRRHQ